MTPTTTAKPVLFAFVAAAFWGLWWIPVRWLAGLGLDGALAGVAMTTGALVLCAVFMLVAPSGPRLSPRALAGALLAGIAVALFSAALNFSDVVRVILLFYLAPAWSKIIEWLWLDMPWRWTSTLALGASALGMVVLLGGDFGSGGIRSGDVMALLSGLFWAAGAAFVFTAGPVGVMRLTLVCCLAAVLTGLPLALLAGAALVSVAQTASIWGMGIGVLYVAPILIVTLWSAQRLSPATLSFLLTAELLSGIISGALLLDEPFGVIQMLGAALVLLGAVSEVLPKLRLGALAR